MNTENFIILENVQDKTAELMVQELADLYDESGFTKDIQIFKSKNNHIIIFKNQPDFERFQYFVNYLSWYDEPIKNKEICGFYNISKCELVPKELQNKRVMIYVSETDDEGDNVMAIAKHSSHLYKLKFGLEEQPQLIKELDQNYDEPYFDVDKIQLFKIIHSSASNIESSTKEYSSYEPITFFRKIYWSFLRVFGEGDDFLSHLKSLTLLVLSQYVIVRVILNVVTYYDILNLKDIKYDWIILVSLVLINLILVVDKPLKATIKGRSLIIYYLLIFMLFVFSTSLIYP